MGGAAQVLAEDSAGPFSRDLVFCGPPLHPSTEMRSVVQWMDYHLYYVGFDHMFLYEIAGTRYPELQRYVDAGVLSFVDFVDQRLYPSWYNGQVSAPLVLQWLYSSRCDGQASAPQALHNPEVPRLRMAGEGVVGCALFLAALAVAECHTALPFAACVWLCGWPLVRGWQSLAMHHCLYQNRESAGWVAYGDLDEYLEAPFTPPQPIKSFLRDLQRRTPPTAYVSHGCYHFYNVCEEPIWGAGQPKYAVELLPYRPAEAFCQRTRNTPAADAPSDLCPDAFGRRKAIVNPRMVRAPPSPLVG